jgi:hypothetical protein
VPVNQLHVAENLQLVPTRWGAAWAPAGYLYPHMEVLHMNLFFPTPRLHDSHMLSLALCAPLYLQLCAFVIRL